jgi:hypothetical protein
MRVIIAGSRDFDDYDYLKQISMELIINNFGLFDETVTIVSGTARGADSLGEKFARENSFEIVRFPAEWESLGKKAGYLRNKEMVKYAKEDSKGMLIAFWDGKSKGTKHIINTAKKEKLKTYVKKY